VFEGGKESHQMCEERVSGIPDHAAYCNLSRAVFLFGEGATEAPMARVKRARAKGWQRAGRKAAQLQRGLY
jgi:hypothetical protein